MKTIKRTVFFSLGSNLGDRKSNLLNAINELEKDSIKIIKKSSFYLTEPVGNKDQAEFINIAVKAETILFPQDLLTHILDIEKRLGRVREKFQGPRIIDIDIIFYQDMVIQSNDLIIPHPEMHKRNFVLLPLLEIEKDLIHPVLGNGIKDFIGDNKGKTVKIA